MWKPDSFSWYAFFSASSAHVGANALQCQPVGQRKPNLNRQPDVHLGEKCSTSLSASATINAFIAVHAPYQVLGLRTCSCNLPGSLCDGSFEIVLVELPELGLLLELFSYSACEGESQGCC